MAYDQTAGANSEAEKEYTMSSRSKWALLIFAFSTVFGLFFAGHLYMDCAHVRRPISWIQALRVTLTGWYIWAALAPVIFWLSRKFPLERIRWPGSVAVHVVTGLIFAFLKLAIENKIASAMGGQPRAISSVNYQLNFLTYWAIVGACHAVHYYRFYRQYQERALRASQLEVRLAQAQLQLLKMQLQPHFLFNTLHAISALTYKNPKAADRMITRLSDLLRFTLESANLQEIPLRREMEVLETYLEIEQTRFGDRLVVNWDIDSETLDAQVPSLILQPLVENAIRHGIGQRASGGRIEVCSKLQNGIVYMQVRDDGPGLSANSQFLLREGIGLANTRARLQKLYGEGYQLELANEASGGVVAKLTIPFQIKEKANGQAISVDCG